MFQESVIYYEDTLNKAGHINSNQENKNKNHQRNVIWFNLPCSNSVTTRIGQSFLYLLDIHFPKSHTFNKIFSRNNVNAS